MLLAPRNEQRALTCSNEVQETRGDDQEDLEFSSVSSAALSLAAVNSLMTVCSLPVDEIADSSTCDNTTNNGEWERRSWQTESDATNEHDSLEAFAEYGNER